MNNREIILNEKFWEDSESTKNATAQQTVDILQMTQKIQFVIFQSKKSSEQVKQEIKEIFTWVEKHETVRIINEVLYNENYTMSDTQRGILKSFKWIPEEISFILSIIKDQRPYIPVQNESQKLALMWKIWTILSQLELDTEEYEIYFTQIVTMLVNEWWIEEVMIEHMILGRDNKSLNSIEFVKEMIEKAIPLYLQNKKSTFSPTIEYFYQMMFILYDELPQIKEKLKNLDISGVIQEIKKNPLKNEKIIAFKDMYSYLSIRLEKAYKDWITDQTDLLHMFYVFVAIYLNQNSKERSTDYRNQYFEDIREKCDRPDTSKQLHNKRAFFYEYLWDEISEVSVFKPFLRLMNSPQAKKCRTNRKFARENFLNLISEIENEENKRFAFTSVLKTIIERASNSPHSIKRWNEVILPALESNIVDESVILDLTFDLKRSTTKRWDLWEKITPWILWHEKISIEDKETVVTYVMEHYLAMYLNYNNTQKSDCMNKILLPILDSECVSQDSLSYLEREMLRIWEKNLLKSLPLVAAYLNHRKLDSKIRRSLSSQLMTSVFKKCLASPANWRKMIDALIENGPWVSSDSVLSFVTEESVCDFVIGYLHHWNVASKYEPEMIEKFGTLIAKIDTSSIKIWELHKWIKTYIKERDTSSWDPLVQEELTLMMKHIYFPILLKNNFDIEKSTAQITVVLMRRMIKYWSHYWKRSEVIEPILAFVNKYGDLQKQSDFVYSKHNFSFMHDNRQQIDPYIWPLYKQYGIEYHRLY